MRNEETVSNDPEQLEEWTQIGEAIRASGLVSDGKHRPWAEQKKRARNRATRYNFELEQILLDGPLKGAVRSSVKCAIKLREQGYTSSEEFLNEVAVELADEIGMRFRDGNSLDITDDAREMAMTLLYLFPDFWKACNKRLTLEKIKTLDVESLLSNRRG